MSALKINKVEIITRSSKLDELVQALNDIGVLGMTVSQVFGSGLHHVGHGGDISVETYANIL